MKADELYKYIEEHTAPDFEVGLRIPGHAAYLNAIDVEVDHARGRVIIICDNRQPMMQSPSINQHLPSVEAKQAATPSLLAFTKAQLLSEAEASTRMDKEGEGQTWSLPAAEETERYAKFCERYQLEPSREAYQEFLAVGDKE